jgi:hypothetical protein
MALALLVLASTTAAQPVGLGLNANRIPVAAATFLQRHRPPGTMLNSYNFGGYLMWAYPREKVFIDSRAFMIYSEAHVRDLLHLYENRPFPASSNNAGTSVWPCSSAQAVVRSSQRGCARSLTGK